MIYYFSLFKFNCYAKTLAGKLNPDLKANLNGHSFMFKFHCYAKTLAGKLNPDLKANLNEHPFIYHSIQI